MEELKGEKPEAPFSRLTKKKKKKLHFQEKPVTTFSREARNYIFKLRDKLGK